MTPPLRRALETVLAERGISLDRDDVEAIVQAMASASAWVADEEAMYLTGRSSVASLRDYCSSYNVTRQQMANRYELDKAIRGMVGRGHGRRPVGGS